MKDKLQQAVQIFKELDWEGVDAKTVLTLPIGTKEQQKLVLEGLKKGDWFVFEELEKNSYGARPLVDVPLDELALFAIRVGVSVARGLNVARASKPEALCKVVAHRGEKYATDFIAAACVSRRRGWEHSLTVYGNVAVSLLHQLDLPIPQSVEYIKDWVVCAAHALGLEVDMIRNTVFMPSLDMLQSRFLEHLQTAVDFSAPASGPLGELLPKAVSEKLLTKEQGQELALTGLYNAQRPLDRKIWLEMLDQLEVSDNQLLDKIESLLPLLAFGEAAIIQRLAPLFIQQGPEHLLSEIMMASLSAKANKTKELVLKAASVRKAPSNAEEIAPWISGLTADKNQGLAKAAQQLMSNWQLESQEEAEEPQAVQGLWQATPMLWECPRFQVGSITPEALTDLGAELFSRQRYVDDLKSEAFLAAVGQLAYGDMEQAKLSLGGVVDDGWSHLQSNIHLWAKNKDSSIADGTHAKHVYAPVFERNYIVSKHLGKLPCLLSTPSYADLSITLEDLVSRLQQYQEAKVYPLEADLFTALMRLDVSTANEALKQALAQIKIPVHLLDNTKMKTGAGKLVLDYLGDPLVLPRDYTGSNLVLSFQEYTPQSLAEFPKRLENVYSHESIALFPSGTDAALTAIYSDCEVYHEQGLIMRQAARRKTPFPKGATMNFVASLRSLTPSAAEDALLATKEAWQRGLLRPHSHDIARMDWHDGPPDRLAAFAKSTELLIEDGMLSLVWLMLDELVEISLQQVRMIAGTLDIVLLIEKYLPEVLLAVGKGLVDQEALHLPGIRQLAQKKGKSIAITTAQSIVSKLPDEGNFEAENQVAKDEKQSAEAPKDFDDVWQVVQNPKPIIKDEATLTMAWLDKSANKKRLHHRLTLPGSSEELSVVIADWIYSITEEGQLQGMKNRGQSDEEQIYIHYDIEQKQLVVTDHRNWMKNHSGPLERNSQTPLTFGMMTILIAALAQDGDGYYSIIAELRKQMAEGSIHDGIIKEILPIYLQNPDVNCGKLLYPLEKGEPLLSIMWPVFIESVKFAGEKIAQQEAPPKWINRVLDNAIALAPYLKEAAKRGLIPAEDGKWQGLQAIAQAKKKSAATDKAKQLMALLDLK